MRKDISGELIMAIFTAIINIDTHKEEIGLEYFPEVQEYITEFKMKGLKILQRTKSPMRISGNRLKLS